MAKKPEIIEENIVENISVEPLEDVMGDRYATYAKYVQPRNALTLLVRLWELITLMVILLFMKPSLE